MPDGKVRFTPHQKRQLAILIACRFSEPVALTSVWPYLYFMVKSFDVPTKDIPFWVGIIGASFNFMAFATGIFWGRASDRFGRKPTIVAGLTGTMLATILFGFSQNLWMAMVARCLSGALNGNVGILRTMVAEIVTEKELQPRAFSLMPLTFGVASILGPIIGGYLSEPAKTYPRYFDQKGLFGRYPFLLPNLICATMFFIAVLFGLFFIEETLWTKKDRPDPFLKLGQKFSACIGLSNSDKAKGKFTGERQPLLQNSASSSTVDEETLYKERQEFKKTPSLRDALSRQSVLNVLVYMLLALHVTYDQLFPVLLSTPPSDPTAQRPPFRFVGGFGLGSADIGNIFSLYGLLMLPIQFFIFPKLAVKYGPVRLFRWITPIFPLTYLAAPYTVLIPNLQTGAYVLIGITILKKIGEVFAFPCSTIMVTNSAPSLRVLGTLNGIVTSLGALARGVGPTVGGALFTWGEKHEFILAPYIALTLVTLSGAYFLKDIVEMEGPAQRDAKLAAERFSDEDSDDSLDTLHDRSRSPLPR
ncbi:MFS general substrate transporter [Ascobolus immersus RN42]|uniref:MFS general substrate transporter n=1 Tax=Ascobolus immersus RN42 TaxID=1160509 RepID=A0A3N4HSN6_ASCIM|nr:MFS general substrate transporter [Ascobolus immersus RN42]